MHIYNSNLINTSFLTTTSKFHAEFFFTFPDLTLLRRFLKCVNFDLEETKKLLELNYQLRNKSPHLFINQDPNDELTKQAFETV